MEVIRKKFTVRGVYPICYASFSANNLGFLHDFGEINFYFPKTISPG